MLSRKEQDDCKVEGGGISISRKAAKKQNVTCT